MESGYKIFRKFSLYFRSLLEERYCLTILHMKNNFLTKLSLLALVFAGAMFAQRVSAADVQCTFTRDLALGDTGEDIRCLQKYLNGAGFTVATEGVGSPGNETSLYREKTVEAVKKWQTARGISPATGTFGPLSRLSYTKSLAASLTTPATPAVPTVSPAVPATPAAPAQSAQEKSARTKLKAAIESLEDAKNEFNDAEDDDEDTGDAEDLIEEANENLFDAFRSFLLGDYGESIDYADEARRNSEDAQGEIDGDSGDNSDADEEDADEAINDAEDDIDSAEEDIQEAEDNDEDTGDAGDLLDEAQDLLDDAEEAFDDEDWDEVIDIVDEINDILDDIDEELD